MNDDFAIPLLPLNLVVFPDGVLGIKVYEAGYIDMVQTCWEKSGCFGIVSLYPKQIDAPDDTHISKVGVLVSILGMEIETPGTLTLQCQAGIKIRIRSAVMDSAGVWIAQVQSMEERHYPIPDDLHIAAEGLKGYIRTAVHAGEVDSLPIMPPFKFTDCGWVANRWCELLDYSLEEQQRLLEIDSPVLRLELVQDTLLTEFPSYL